MDMFTLKNCSIRPMLFSKREKTYSLTSPLQVHFTWLTPPGPYRAMTCRGREVTFGSHTYFLEHTRAWRVSPHEGSAQCRGHLRDSTNRKDDTHQAHTHSFQQGEYEMVIMAAKWYSGTFVGLKFPNICPKGEEKSRKTLTQETCPDRGSKPGPLRDKRAFYRLFHSGGHKNSFHAKNQLN